MLTRRRFLMGAAALGVTAACRSGPARKVAPPDTRPTTTLPEGADTLPQIEHIVILMMENHSFDNYFGMLGRGDGFTLAADGRPANSSTDARGRAVLAFEMPTPCQ